VVAHHLSVIVVQAEAAQEVLCQPDQQAGDGHRRRHRPPALGALRRVLGVLRSEGATAGGLADLGAVDDLVASVRQAGLTVAVRTEAAPGGRRRRRDRPRGAEALTNVLRHAAARRARWARLQPGRPGRQ
jgi:hypothetical protein